MKQRAFDRRVLGLRSRVPSWREGGSAMLPALALSLITAMAIGAGLYVSNGHRSQTWAEARSDAALLLADGGINDEMALIASTVGDPTFSPPVVSNGETMVYPGESHPVYGRKGSISGFDGTFWVCTTLNEWWRSRTSPVSWDGTTSPYWITATAYVKGSWRRSAIKVSKRSIFSQYAFFADGQYGLTDDIVTVTASASATVTGMAGTNGQVNLNGGSGISLGNTINANKTYSFGPQFPASVVRAGSTLFTRAAPVAFVRTIDAMKKVFGLTGSTDAAVALAMLARANNSTGIYHYRLGALSSTLSPSNCTRATVVGNTLENYNLLNILLPTKGTWDVCNVKPGTAGKVKSLIFEPGDYYLSDINLNYDATTELVIDPMALASGGTPGPVRFWVYDVPLLGGSDHLDLPVVMTKASGATTPNPSLFRIYYAKDGYSLTLNRPANVKDYTGANLTGDFNLYGCVYSITKPTNINGLITNLLWYGTKVSLVGTSGTSNGRVVVNGSVIADRIGFAGPCAINYVSSVDSADPGLGATILGDYRDGK